LKFVQLRAENHAWNFAEVEVLDTLPDGRVSIRHGKLEAAVPVGWLYPIPEKIDYQDRMQRKKLERMRDQP
jgi:hypothetical protein